MTSMFHLRTFFFASSKYFCWNTLFNVFAFISNGSNVMYTNRTFTFPFQAQFRLYFLDLIQTAFAKNNISSMVHERWENIRFSFLQIKKEKRKKENKTWKTRAETHISTFVAAWVKCVCNSKTYRLEHVFLGIFLLLAFTTYLCHRLLWLRIT